MSDTSSSTVLHPSLMKLSFRAVSEIGGLCSDLDSELKGERKIWH